MEESREPSKEAQPEASVTPAAQPQSATPAAQPQSTAPASEPQSALPAAQQQSAAPAAPSPAAEAAPAMASEPASEPVKAPESAQVRAVGRREGDRAFGVGRRKTAVARVIISPGGGKISIDGREVAEYFRRRKLIDEVNMPFVLTGTSGRFDMTARVRGSSLAAQAGAVRLALARALAAWQQEYRAPLAAGRMLTRDPRMVERKKYGIRGARRRPQWTKR